MSGDVINTRIRALSGHLCNAAVTALPTIALVFLLFCAPLRAAEPIRILALGDSLTAGYGLDDPADGFVRQLEDALRAKGHDVTVLPGGVSGDTTTGGLSRLEWSLADKPDAVIVELGGNDGLRGIDPDLTKANIDAIVRGVQARNIPVLLTGMMAPPNMGRDYTERFAGGFAAVAKDTGALFYPFFLDGVAAVPELNQGDRIHPNADGVKVIVSRILPYVEKLIAQVGERRSAAAR